MNNDVVDLFLSQASSDAAQPAIVTRNKATTYGELEVRVRALAAEFAKWPEPKVLIALPPSVDAYASILASGMAGGFHTPLNMASPIEKMQRIVRQLEPDIIVAESALLDRLCAVAPSAARLDPSGRPLTRQFSGRGTRHRLAYVFFTSGSTGQPKGVMVSRNALSTYVQWMRTFKISNQDRISQQPNIAFDISMTDIFGALCFGATLYPLELEGDRLMPARFIARNGITIWNSTPSVVSLMMQARQVRESNLGTVRLFNFCGEPLLKEHLDSLFSAVPEAVIQNTYGPTEATISVTALAMTKSDYGMHCRTSVALGDTIPETDIVLVGGPDADEGEIVITGPQLADGYWQDPAATARSFRETVKGGSRGYFTGDWAVRLDGELFFKERIDFQVKVRGNRVELDEVAAAIRAIGYPAVCVFKKGEALAAVVEVPQDGANFEEQALRGALTAKLEPHAIPERIIMVPRIPRNENDKLDRKASAELFDALIGGQHVR